MQKVSRLGVKKQKKSFKVRGNGEKQNVGNVIFLCAICLYFLKIANVYFCKFGLK